MDAGAAGAKGWSPMNAPSADSTLRHRVISVDARPVIDSETPGAEDNLYGFEGGRTVLHEGAVNLFTAERFADPMIVKMRLGHWRLAPGGRWERVSTLFESSGEFTGADPRAALWGPMPIFDEAENRWTLFYVAYRAKPNTADAWYENHDGRIWRAVSIIPGRGGLEGPYGDIGVILEPDAESQPWEGLQGVDSFHAHRAADGRWIGFYGSAQTQLVPCRFWGVGLAEAPALAGPWRRVPTGNPVKMDDVFAENPVVDRVGDLWVAMVDGGPTRGCFGYAVSRDGISWSRASWIDLRGALPEPWWRTMRTPLGLVPEADGSHSVYFTALRGLPEKGKDYGAVGRARIALSRG
jgi:hypothetical protein